MVMRMTKLGYWDKRYLRIKAQELENVANYESNLKPRLSSLEYELEQEANTWYSKYASNHDIDVDTAKQLLKTVGSTNWKMTLAEFRRKAIKGGYTKELDSEYFKSRIARLQDLEEQLKEISSRFASDETDSLSNRLTNQFQETYMTTIFNTQVQQNKLTSNFAQFNEDQVKYIVNQPWHKEDFSKRVWKNYRDELPGQLVDVMLRGTFMGYSPERITKMFQQRFEGIRRHQIHRLVITEMGHIAEQATSKAYEESGIEEYEYMATLESHTCEVCARLDGKIFKMSEKREGINYPLIHPHCRCTTVPHIEDLPDVKERWMRDPETDKGKIINNMSFDEWKNKYANGNKSGAVSHDWDSKPTYNNNDKIAYKLYDEFTNRKMKPQIDRIEQNTGFSSIAIQKVFNHIFVNQHRFDNGDIKQFDPSYDMAISWQHLLSKSGKEISNADIMLLEHEMFESIIMTDNQTTYEKAHKQANEIYNYSAELYKEERYHD